MSDERTAYALKFRREGFKERQVNLFEKEIGDAERWEVNVVLDPLEQTAPVRGVLTD